ncbi:TPA: hypothetical protein QDB23_000167 [Burkholderia vietnamiensis]|nr:hypothetical protein [Burkholderia vietnamiensis]
MTQGKYNAVGSAGRRVDGIVFEVVMAWGESVEVIGVPFEHRGRVFAVHPAIGSSALTGSQYCVSDVEHGWRVPDSGAVTIDDARAAAIASLDARSDSQWRSAFASTRKRVDGRQGRRPPTVEVKIN